MMLSLEIMLLLIRRYCTTKLDIGDYVHMATFYCVIIGGHDAKLTMDHLVGLAAGAKIVCGGDDF